MILVSISADALRRYDTDLDEGLTHVAFINKDEVYEDLPFLVEELRVRPQVFEVIRVV